jgi:hypothetical protein
MARVKSAQMHGHGDSEVNKLQILINHKLHFYILGAFTSLIISFEVSGYISILQHKTWEPITSTFCLLARHQPCTSCKESRQWYGSSYMIIAQSTNDSLTVKYMRVGINCIDVLNCVHTFSDSNYQKSY